MYALRIKGLVKGKNGGRCGNGGDVAQTTLVSNRFIGLLKQHETSSFSNLLHQEEMNMMADSLTIHSVHIYTETNLQ